MNPAIFRKVFVPHSLELLQVVLLLLLEELELLSDALFLVLEQLYAELVNFFLLVLVHVIKFTLFQVEF